MGIIRWELKFAKPVRGPQMMNTIQYIFDETGYQTGVIVPIALWRKIFPNDTDTYQLEPDILTLSDRDQDRFLAMLESPPAPNAKLTSSMQQYLMKFGNELHN